MITWLIVIISIVLICVTVILLMSRLLNKEYIDFKIGLRDLETLSKLNPSRLREGDISIINYTGKDTDYWMALSLPAYLWFLIKRPISSKANKEKAFAAMLKESEEDKTC